MRIITDLHHSVLYESLAMLFVDRAILGPAELLVWVDGHYVTESGPQVEEFGRKPYAVAAAKHRLAIGGVDMVISTVSGTREPLRAVAERCGALYVDHIGNAWDEPIGNVVLRAAYGKGPEGVVYHPEFHRVPWTPPTGNRIGAFHASLPHMPCWQDWLRAQEQHPEYEFILYGTEQTQLRPHQVAQARADCIAIWHCKDADGYGFGVHEAFASGRAVIGHRRHYEGKIAEPLFIRSVSYVEPDVFPPLDYSELMGGAALDVFNNNVDFDAEAAMVRDYLLEALG